MNVNDKRDLKVQTNSSDKLEDIDDIRKKPTTQPKRDFQGVMKRKEDEDGQQKKLVSRKTKKDGENSIQDSDEEEVSPEALFASQQTSKGSITADEQPPSPKTAKSTNKAKDRAEFMQEQQDLSGISSTNSFVSGVSSEKPSETEFTESGDMVKKIQEIVDQIVNKIYTLKQGGQTDTVLTLRHPPLFQGAQLKLTEFDNAKGEFNITFSNLRTDAKAVLDAFQAQNSLQRALEQRGYVAHIVVVTTEKDEPIASNSPSEQTGSSTSYKDREEKEKEKQKKR